MAVKEIKTDSDLTLTLDNGDYKKFNEAMKKWNFNDSQSLMRFCISVLLLSEDQLVTIKSENRQKSLSPAPELLEIK